MTEPQKPTGNGKNVPAPLVERGMSLEQWRVLQEVIWPGAKSKEAVLMAWDYCKARGLDPFKKPVHIVEVWDGKLKKMVETIWPGISEIRTTASRTRQYAGKSEPEYGPDVTKTLGESEFTFPEWCKITVYKLIGGERCPYTAVVYWEEAYAKKKKTDETPNSMWTRRKRGQLAKCTEAEALREAFPEETGGMPTAEEMEGQAINLVESADQIYRPAAETPEEPAAESFEVVTIEGEIVQFTAPDAYAEAVCEDLEAAAKLGDQVLRDQWEGNVSKQAGLEWLAKLDRRDLVSTINGTMESLLGNMAAAEDTETPEPAQAAE